MDLRCLKTIRPLNSTSFLNNTSHLKPILGSNIPLIIRKQVFKPVYTTHKVIVQRELTIYLASLCDIDSHTLHHYEDTEWLHFDISCLLMEKYIYSFLNKMKSQSPSPYSQTLLVALELFVLNRMNHLKNPWSPEL